MTEYRYIDTSGDGLRVGDTVIAVWHGDGRVSATVPLPDTNAERIAMARTILGDQAAGLDAATDAVLDDWLRRYDRGDKEYEPDPSHRGIVRAALETALPYLVGVEQGQAAEPAPGDAIDQLNIDRALSDTMQHLSRLEDRLVERTSEIDTRISGLAHRVSSTEVNAREQRARVDNLARIMANVEAASSDHSRLINEAHDGGRELRRRMGTVEADQAETRHSLTDIEHAIADVRSRFRTSGPAAETPAAASRYRDRDGAVWEDAADGSILRLVSVRSDDGHDESATIRTPLPRMQVMREYGPLTPMTADAAAGGDA